jgi:mannose-6-phosphate isomerase-like protein (cupin superfamily)
VAQPAPEQTRPSPNLAAELQRNELNPCVGQILLSESEKARVWYIRLAPGERLGFHRHVLDYFWTALNAGTAKSHVNGGPPKLAKYFAGQTQHLTFGPGEFMIHDLENVGSTELAFVTVEYLESANPPLPFPPEVTPRGMNKELVA